MIFRLSQSADPISIPGQAKLYKSTQGMEVVQIYQKLACKSDIPMPNTCTCVLLQHIDLSKRICYTRSNGSMQYNNRVLPHQIDLTKLFPAQCLDFLGKHEPEGELLERDKFVAIVVCSLLVYICAPFSYIYDSCINLRFLYMYIRLLSESLLTYTTFSSTCSSSLLSLQALERPYA